MPNIIRFVTILLLCLQTKHCEYGYFYSKRKRRKNLEEQIS